MSGSKRWSGQKRVLVPVDAAAIAAAEREALVCTTKLAELARGHPSVKIWRARLAKAQKVLGGR